MDSSSRHSTNIILNHDFSGGLHSWHPNSCHAFVNSEESAYPEVITAKLSGRYAVATNRKKSWQGLKQVITERVSTGCTYTVCALVGVSGAPHGVDNVKATLILEYGNSVNKYLSIGRDMVDRFAWDIGGFLREPLSMNFEYLEALKDDPESIRYAYSRRMQPEIVEKLLLEMEATGLEPNVRSYTCLISAYGRQKKMSDVAANVFHYDIYIYSCPRFQEGVLLSQADGEKWPSSRCQIISKAQGNFGCQSKDKEQEG